MYWDAIFTHCKQLGWRRKGRPSRKGASIETWETWPGSVLCLVTGVVWPWTRSPLWDLWQKSARCGFHHIVWNLQFLQHHWCQCYTSMVDSEISKWVVSIAWANTGDFKSFAASDLVEWFWLIHFCMAALPHSILLPELGQETEAGRRREAPETLVVAVGEWYLVREPKGCQLGSHAVSCWNKDKYCKCELFKYIFNI